MRIAFLILSHREPSQLLRLVATIRLQLPDSPIVIHHDTFREPLPKSALDLFHGVHLIAPEGPTGWGDFTVVAAACRSMEWMIKHLEFNWMVLLSAQDYPIKPLAGFGDYLEQGGADVLLDATPITHVSRSQAARRDIRRRYLYQYRPRAINLQADQPLHRLPRGLRWWTGRLVDVINIIQPCFKLYRLPDGMPYRFGLRRVPTFFGKDNPCWKGSPWFGFSRRAAEFVLNYLHDNPHFVNYYRRTIMPDESMLPTLVCNSKELRVDQRTVHHVRWTNPNSGHPDIFGIEDLPELMAVPQYFARKFDITKDVFILDELDAILGHQCLSFDTAPTKQRLLVEIVS
jgi:core-2/I-Branching enzyme